MWVNGGYHPKRVNKPFPIYATQQNPEVLKMMVSTLVQIVQQDKDAMIEEGIITAKEYEEAMQEPACMHRVVPP